MPDAVVDGSTGGSVNAVVRRDVSELVPFVVDEDGIHAAHYRIRISPERLDAEFQAARVAKVIVGVPHEVFAAGQLINTLVVPERPQVLFGAVVADAWVAGRELAADRLGLVV